MYICGTKLQFLSPSGQKNLIFSEIFPFLANKCTFVVPNSSFYPQFVRSGQKNFIFSEIVPFLGTNVHLGVPNSSFYPNRVKKTSFLVKCFHFREQLYIWGYQTPVFIPIGSKKLHF